MKKDKSKFLLISISVATIVSILMGQNIYHSFAQQKPSTVKQVEFVTKEEFEALAREVENIKSGELTNLGGINKLDTRLTKEIENRGTAFKESEFKFQGVGDIVASALPTDQFRKSHDDTKPPFKWFLCNGDPAPENSKYKALLTEANNSLAEAKKIPLTLPNLIGRYPRGLDDNFSLLQRLDDQLQTHIHRIEGQWRDIPDLKADGGNNNGVVFGTGKDFKTVGVTEARTGDETRPKTTVVNFFIRVN